MKEDLKEKLILRFVVFRSLFKKYFIETLLFVFTTIVAFTIELSDYRVYVDWNIDTEKLNGLIFLFSSAYSISYIFLFTTAIVKEWDACLNMYPLICKILNRTISVYNEYDRLLRFLYKENIGKDGFSYETDVLEKLVEACEHSQYCDYYIQRICRNNYLIATQIINDMEALRIYQNYLEPQFVALTLDISGNIFLIQYNKNLHENLGLYKGLIKDLIELNSQYRKLEKYSYKRFGRLIRRK